MGTHSEKVPPAELLDLGHGEILASPQVGVLRAPRPGNFPYFGVWRDGASDLPCLSSSPRISFPYLVLFTESLALTCR
jgi:hypothetical protein